MSILVHTMMIDNNSTITLLNIPSHQVLRSKVLRDSLSVKGVGCYVLTVS